MKISLRFAYCFVSKEDSGIWDKHVYMTLNKLP